jgi:hypothetical protein
MASVVETYEGVPGSATTSGKQHRGPPFSEGDVYALAIAWVKRSSRVDEQSERTFWPGVVEEPEKQGGMPGRSVKSVQNKWSELQRCAQKWIVARKLVESARPSGRSSEDVFDMVQERYRNVTGTKDETGKTASKGQSFKYHRAADYLSTQAKFSFKYCGTSRDVPGYRTPAKRRPDDSGLEPESYSGETYAAEKALEVALSESAKMPYDSAVISEDRLASSSRSTRPHGVKKLKAAESRAKQSLNLHELIKKTSENSAKQTQALISAMESSMSNLNSMLLVHAMPEGPQKEGLLLNLLQKEQEKLKSSKQLKSNHVLEENDKEHDVSKETISETST